MLNHFMTREFSEINFGSSELRYEIKLVFSELDRGLVRSAILGHSSLFRKAFPDRQVNNIYFDTIDHQLRNDHIQGSLNRSKIRFRWYHSTWEIRQGQLEIKSKHANLGKKINYPIQASVNLEENGWRDIQRLISDHLPKEVKAGFEQTRPILVNHYQREYYEDAERKIRITLDYGLRSYDQAFSIDPNLRTLSPMQNVGVLELKAAAENYRQVSRVLDEFPQYAQAYSKYLQGVESSGI